MMTVLIFFAVAFLLTRDVVLIPSIDAVNHYHFSHVVAIYEQPRITYGYEMFYTAFSFILALFEVDPRLFLWAQNTLNILVPLALYLLSYSYLKSIDSKAPAMALLFSYLGTGFAWVQFLREYFTWKGSMHSLLSRIYSQTYSMSGYSSMFYYLGFLPIAVGYICLAIILTLLRNRVLSFKTKLY